MSCVNLEKFRYDRNVVSSIAVEKTLKKQKTKPLKLDDLTQQSKNY